MCVCVRARVSHVCKAKREHQIPLELGTKIESSEKAKWIIQPWAFSLAEISFFWNYLNELTWQIIFLHFVKPTNVEQINLNTYQPL